MKEVWKDIKGYEGKYQISDIGNLRSLNYNRQKIVKPIKPRLNKQGYLRIGLSNGGKRYYFVHILVYTTFIGIIPKGMQVNHINEIKTDNRKENLSLLTPKENCNWGTHNKKISERQLGNNNSFYGKHHSEYQKERTRQTLQKKVSKYSKDNNYICSYNSVKEAAILNNIAACNISSVCNHTPHHKTAGGFIWKYDN